MPQENDPQMVGIRYSRSKPAQSHQHGRPLDNPLYKKGIVFGKSRETPPLCNGQSPMYPWKTCDITVVFFCSFTLENHVLYMQDFPASRVINLEIIRTTHWWRITGMVYGIRYTPHDVSPDVEDYQPKVFGQPDGDRQVFIKHLKIILLMRNSTNYIQLELILSIRAFRFFWQWIFTQFV